MDNKTLLIALAIIAVSYTLFFGLLTFKRKDKALLVFTVGYFSSIIIALLTYFQSDWPTVFGVILLNLTYFALLFLLSGGFKVRYNLPLFNKKVFIFFGIYLLLLIFFTYIIPHFSIRIIISSIMSVVVMFINYVDIKKVMDEKTPAYRNIASLILIVYGVIALVRIIYAGFTFKNEGTLLEDSSYTTMNIFIFISLNLWAMLIVSVDYLQFLTKLKNQNELLSKIALKDSLTNLYNRHYLEQEIIRYFNIANTAQEPLSLIIFDLDNFKIVNDVFGHNYGDEVLKTVALTTLNQLRPTDIAVRWGGEEFLIICPNSDINSTNSLAETVRLAVKQAFSNQTAKVTISLGVTDFNQSDSLVTWLRRADYALGQAKKTGKNKTVVWPKEQPLPEAFTTVEWHDSWNSGNIEIDRQHRDIIKESNKLALIALEQGDHERSIAQLEKILNDSIEHFNFEEELLRDIGYSNYIEHRQEHQQLIPRFKNLVEEAKAGKITIKHCFDEIIGTFVIGHILQYDKLYFSSLSSNEKN